MDKQKLIPPNDTTAVIHPEQIRSLLPRAHQDKAALDQLFVLLERDPRLMQSMVDTVGDMAQQAKEAMLKAAAGDDLLKIRCLEQKMEQLRAELAGVHASPLEHLLVERIVLCWFALHQAECFLARHETELTIKQANFHQKRVDRLSRQYLASIKGLAQVRKLQIPNLQVNVADKQVNIGQATIAPVSSADVPTFVAGQTAGAR